MIYDRRLKTIALVVALAPPSTHLTEVSDAWYSCPKTIALVVGPTHLTEVSDAWYFHAPDRG
jgi:hypothetical protein